MPKAFVFICLCSLFVKIVGLENSTALGPTAANPNNKRTRVRFTQGINSGHVGTRFLTSLFANVPKSNSSSPLFWNEVDLHLGNLKNCGCSVALLQQYVLPGKAPDSCGKQWFRGLRWYGPHLKKWNAQGRKETIRNYLKTQVVTDLLDVSTIFPMLDHFVKFGHTVLFYDLLAYHQELSKVFDVDFVRIRRSRVKVARSFASDLGGHRLSPCAYEHSKQGIVTCPKFETALLKPPDSVWQRWNVFQQHLWFADEVEARWQEFRAAMPNVSVFTLRFSANDELTPSSVEQLGRWLGVPSPAKHMRKVSHQSHISGRAKLMAAQDVRLAQEYAAIAPWCKQNSKQHRFSIDCSPQAM